MESINNNQTASPLSNTSKELGRIHRKYHPLENDLFDMVDDKYKNRLCLLLGVEVV